MIESIAQAAAETAANFAPSPETLDMLSTFAQQAGEQLIAGVPDYLTIIGGIAVTLILYSGMMLISGKRDISGEPIEDGIYPKDKENNPYYH